MVAYLSVRSGPESGRQFPLDPQRPMHIGRGVNCEILLTDPISSRFHAVIYHEEGCWQVRDTKSRNGTLVNGQKTDHAMLLDGSVVRVGGTELQLVEHGEEGGLDGSLTQTLLLDRPMAGLTTGPLAPEGGPERPQIASGQLLDLYLLSLQLLGSGAPEEIIDNATRLLRQRTEADVVGFLWVAAEGRLTPERVSPPEAADSVRLSRELTRRVTRDGEAIWIKDQTHTDGDNQWSDAICVPLVAEDVVLGALHLYRERRRFAQGDFELAVASARLLGVALANARENFSLRADRRRLADRNAEGTQLLGESPAMVRLKERIVRVGHANGSVLIRGESGTGKELVARATHQASSRAHRPMLCVNCAAIPRDLVESQLFGHRKGSFTGADSDHRGWFQQAHTGTLFLDEVGELTLEAQAKLLRILEGHPFLPVGATEEVRVDVRVVAATNRDLAEFVRNRQFREDLYYRLSVFELYVPPLRERGGDILLLLEHFLEHFRRQHGRPTVRLSEAARSRLLSYHWPGNIRQLRNVIDSALVMCDAAEIGPDDLGLRDAGVGEIDSLRIDYWEQRLIREALLRSGGSVPQAAKLLGVSRATAYRKIAEYGIER